MGVVVVVDGGVGVRVRVGVRVGVGVDLGLGVRKQGREPSRTATT